MNETFWNVFGDDWRANCRMWQRSAKNPVIPASGQTWKKVWTANTDVLVAGGRKLLYYRGHGTMPGAGDVTHDRIGVAEILGVARDCIDLRDLNDGQPVVDVGEEGAFDDAHALETATRADHGNGLLGGKEAGLTQRLQHAQ